MLPDGHVVIFSSSSDWAHTITPLAGIAWEFCDGENSVEDIVTHVMRYSDNALHADAIGPLINALLCEFEQSGLVTDAKVTS